MKIRFGRGSSYMAMGQKVTCIGTRMFGGNWWSIFLKLPNNRVFLLGSPL